LFLKLQDSRSKSTSPEPNVPAKEKKKRKTKKKSVENLPRKVSTTIQLASQYLTVIC
jgi:hypothetical protein